MVKVKKIEMNCSDPSIIEIDGEKYITEKETFKTIDGVEHSDKIVFKRFDEKEYKDNLNVIIEAISKKTTTKELLKHILKNIDMKTLRRLAKRIKTKKPIKKQYGCLGFKIGDSYVQLAE